MVEALRSTNTYVRACAVAVLARIEGSNDLRRDYLASSLTDPSVEVRLVGVYGLKVRENHTPKAAVALTKLAENQDPVLSREALLTLVRFDPTNGQAAIPVSSRLLADHRPEFGAWLQTPLSDSRNKRPFHSN